MAFSMLTFIFFLGIPLLASGETYKDASLNVPNECECGVAGSKTPSQSERLIFHTTQPLNIGGHHFSQCFSGLGTDFCISHCSDVTHKMRSHKYDLMCFLPNNKKSSKLLEAYFSIRACGNKEWTLIEQAKDKFCCKNGKSYINCKEREEVIGEEEHIYDDVLHVDFLDYNFYNV